MTILASHLSSDPDRFPPPVQHRIPAEGEPDLHYCARCLAPARARQPECAGCSTSFRGTRSFDLLSGTPLRDPDAFRRLLDRGRGDA
jgi:hypothetical protein